MLGYRCDEVSAGKFSPKSSIVFEIYELQNKDIIDYCLEHYNKCFSFSLEKILKKIRDNEKYHESLSEEYIEKVVTKMLNSLSRYFKLNFNQSIWLCKEAQEVKDYYCASEDDLVYEYEIDGSKSICISDLGSEGCFYIGENFIKSKSA